MGIFFGCARFYRTKNGCTLSVKILPSEKNSHILLVCFTRVVHFGILIFSKASVKHALSPIVHGDDTPDQRPV